MMSPRLSQRWKLVAVLNYSDVAWQLGLLGRSRKIANSESQISNGRHTQPECDTRDLRGLSSLFLQADLVRFPQPAQYPII
jgi:hypothetical protein